MVIVKSFFHVSQPIVVDAFHLPVAPVDSIYRQDCGKNISEREPWFGVPVKEIDIQKIGHTQIYQYHKNSKENPESLEYR